MRRLSATSLKTYLRCPQQGSTQVAGVDFGGFVDRIDKVDDDRIRIVDYKTGRSLDLDRVRTEKQLTLYQLGAEEKLGFEVETLALYHVPSQTPFEVPRHGVFTRSNRHRRL